MIELLQRIDPAVGVDIDSSSLRARVDERIGLIGTMRPSINRPPKPWLAAAVAFAVILAVFIPVMLNRTGTVPDYRSTVETLETTPGVGMVIRDSGGGGVRTTGVDGDTIWLMQALSRELVRIDAPSGQIEEVYPIDAYVEGVVIGEGYVWLHSYDNGGEVLRFDPAVGEVDLAIPMGAPPRHMSRWFADQLWVSNENGQLLQISADGVIQSTTSGELKGMAFGTLWVIDPETRVMRNFTADGPGEVVIPTEGMEVREVIEGEGYLWVLEADFSTFGAVHRYGPEGGDPITVPVGFGAHSIVEHGGSIWVTSIWDQTLTRIDPATAEVLMVTPWPGRTGALTVADNSLWLSLYQPGLLVRLDSNAALLEIGEVVIDEVFDGYRLLCTGGGEGPTVLLDSEFWIGPGSWSVIQAQLSANTLVCSHGLVDDRDAVAKVDNLERALVEFGLEGPYVLVAHGTGVASTRLFAEGRSDVAGMILVDPVAAGFTDLLERLLPGQAPEIFQMDDLDLGDLGDIPLWVIGQDLSISFENESFDERSGSEPGTGAELGGAWREGLSFYAALSTNSRSATAFGSNHMVIWETPNVVVDAVLQLIDN
jgi:streptogramin lyase